MSAKADFNAEEWTQVIEGPPLAGLLVIAAHRGGSIRESISLAKVYTEARGQQGESELLDEIVAEQPQLDPKRFGSAEELRAQGPEAVREAVALVEAKGGPEDAAAYREFILRLAETTARSHKEGGFLGIGGQEISAQEQAVLDALHAAVGSA
jgi:hypothetical protein